MTTKVGFKKKNAKNKNGRYKDFLDKKLGGLTIAKYLLSWRLCEEMSQREFAELLSMSPANLCDIEKGRKGVSPEKAYQIAVCLGDDPDSLVALATQEALKNVGLNYKVTLTPAA